MPISSLGMAAPKLGAKKMMETITKKKLPKKRFGLKKLQHLKSKADRHAGNLGQPTRTSGNLEAFSDPASVFRIGKKKAAK